MEVPAPMLNMGAQSPLCRAIPRLSALLCSIEKKHIILLIIITCQCICTSTSYSATNDGF